MNIAMIKLYENDYDYEYEQYYIVKNDKEKIEKLLSIIEDAKSLDYEKRENKYNSGSVIEIAEHYVEKTLEVIDCSRYEIDLY